MRGFTVCCCEQDGIGRQVLARGDSVVFAMEGDDVCAVVADSTLA